MPKADRQSITTRHDVFAIGAGALAAGASLAAVNAAMPPLHNPDAGLIALCDEHIKNHDDFNLHGGHLENDEDPLWAAYERTYALIEVARPVTMAGLLAKARAARNEAFNPKTSGFDWQEGVLHRLTDGNGASRPSMSASCAWAAA